ncbi:MAG: hypothetical protein ACOCQQ_01415 [Candidatus Nanoarchaeia archaeon]
MRQQEISLYKASKKESIEKTLLDDGKQKIEEKYIGARRDICGIIKDYFSGYVGFAYQRAKQKVIDHAKVINATDVVITNVFKRQEYTHNNKIYLSIAATFYTNKFTDKKQHINKVIKK